MGKCYCGLYRLLQILPDEGKGTRAIVLITAVELVHPCAGVALQTIFKPKQSGFDAGLKCFPDCVLQP